MDSFLAFKSNRKSRIGDTMSFETIIGNKAIKEELASKIKQGRITHSYLFLGREGIGKTQFAKEFGKMILCQEEQKEKRPCCRCKSCKEIESENHPDFILIEPIETTIKIEQIRQMQEKLLEKPILSNQKVYILKDADRMTKEAQNCLLKTLEEPPSYITIILIGSNESSFLNTIRSRCTKLFFQPIPEKDLEEFLKNKYQLSEISEIRKKVFEGSIAKAISIQEKQDIYNQIDQVFGNIEQYRLLDGINQLEFLYQQKEEIQELLEYINVLLFEQCKQHPKYIQYIEVVEKTKQKIKANSNYDMSIDSLLYQIWEE